MQNLELLYNSTIDARIIFTFDIIFWILFTKFIIKNVYIPIDIRTWLPLFYASNNEQFSQLKHLNESMLHSSHPSMNCLQTHVFILSSMTNPD